MPVVDGRLLPGTPRADDKTRDVSPAEAQSAQRSQPVEIVAQAMSSWPFTVSSIIPAFNEGPRIGGVIRAAKEQCPAAEIIVVDDASCDDTADQAKAAGAQVIRRPYNIGDGAGVRTGIRAATGDVVVILDADGQHNPADIPRLVKHVGTYDMVIAARPDRASQENVVRWLGNRALNVFGSYLVEMEIKDLTSGFRAMRREVILEFIHLLPNHPGWPVGKCSE